MSESSVKPHGMKLLLNKGEKELHSATVPVQWFFEPDIMEKKPTHVLIIVQSKKDKNKELHGRRILYKVTDAVAYITLYRPHQHRITALVFSDPANRHAKEYLSMTSRTDYEHRINLENIAKNREDYEKKEGIIAFSGVNFKVPREFFKEANTTGWWWKWVNLWYDRQPVDQCEFRNRAIWACTVKPFAALVIVLGSLLLLTLKLASMAVWKVTKLLAYGAGMVIRALYYVLAAPTVFFFGFRPKGILTFMQDENSWRSLEDFSEIKRYTCRESYRVLKKDANDCKVLLTMPITPFELTLGVLGVYALYTGVIGAATARMNIVQIEYWQQIGTVGLGLFAFTSTMIAWFNRKFSFIGDISFVEKYNSWSKERRRLRLEQRTARELERLQREQVPLMQRMFSLERAQNPSINPAELDDPADRLRLVFRANYYAIKSAVCKPFAR